MEALWIGERAVFDFRVVCDGTTGMNEVVWRAAGQIPSLFLDLGLKDGVELKNTVEKVKAWRGLQRVVITGLNAR